MKYNLPACLLNVYFTFTLFPNINYYAMLIIIINIIINNIGKCNAFTIFTHVT